MGNIHHIELSNGSISLVDMADRHLVSEYRWCPGGTKNGYATARVNSVNVYLHRLIMGAGPGDVIDHIDGDPLNCLRVNLRQVTRSQNAANLSCTNNQTGFRGVAYYPVKVRYQARVMCKGATFRGPYRREAEEAAQDFDAMARGIFGEHATYNFPRQGERGVKVGPV